MAGIGGRVRGWGVAWALVLAGCAGPPEADAPAARAPVATTDTVDTVAEKASASHPPVEPRIEAVRDAREFGLRRGWASGAPVYEVVIDARGEVWYFGESGTPRLGVHTGHVMAAAVHQTLREALDLGFMITPEEEEDDPHGREYQRVYTTVALEQRKAVVGHAGSLAVAIDKLMAKTVWDEVPRVDPPDPAACPALARAIAGRCAEFLRFKEQPGDCVFWLFLSDTLVERNGPQPTTPQRCARHLRSLQASAREAVERRRPKFGKRCREWHEQTLERCLPWLEKGEFPYACGSAREEIGRLSRVLSDDASRREHTPEQWCDEHISGYAR